MTTPSPISTGTTYPTLVRHHAIIAEFDTPGDAIRAAEIIRDAGFRKWDVHTPFAVHGMDAAMGLKNSKVGWFSFFGGCLGMATGMSMIWFMNGFDYQIVVGGKPLFSPLYAFPVSYELTILFASFATLFGMFGMNRLPRLHHPLLRNRRFLRATHDKFILVIETADPKYSETETRKLLEKAGSKQIEMVEET
ncbi:MAG: DUF3341 domain-containing protein [Verrucomicrobiota bacterium]